MKLVYRGLILGTVILAELAVAVALFPVQATAHPPIQIAQGTPSITDYVFTDGEWEIKIKRKGQDLIYDGLNKTEGKGIRITGVRKSGTKARHIYTWRNRGAFYIVIWQPNDPSFARLQVKDGSKIVLDKLLEAPAEEN